LKSKTKSYTAGQLQYIVSRACSDGTLTERTIRGYLADLAKEITGIEARIRELRELATGSAATGNAKTLPARAAASARRPKTTTKLRRGRTSAKNAASRKIQGRYIAYLRQIPQKDRPRYQELAKTRGREVAIAAMQKARGR
jgi:hypothetical protein